MVCMPTGTRDPVPSSTHDDAPDAPSPGGNPGAASPLPERRSQQFGDAVRRVQESGMDPVEIAASGWALTKSAWHYFPRPFRMAAITITRTFRAYSSDQCNIFAAAIAYYAIFSMIPLAVITLSVISLVISERQLIDFLYEQLPLDESEDLSTVFQNVIRTTRDLSLAGILAGTIVLGWSASGVFSAIRQGLNATRHEKKNQNFFRGKLIDIALIPAFGALIFMGLISAVITQELLSRLPDWELVRGYRDSIWRAATFGIALSTSFLFFILIYRLVPSIRPGWKEAAVAAICATVLLELTRQLVTVILGFTSFSTNAALYASLATALAVLFVMRILGSILLLGSEFGRVVFQPGHAGADDLESP